MHHDKKEILGMAYAYYLHVTMMTNMVISTAMPRS